MTQMKFRDDTDHQDYIITLSVLEKFKQLDNLLTEIDDELNESQSSILCRASNHIFSARYKLREGLEDLLANKERIEKESEILEAYEEELKK